MNKKFTFILVSILVLAGCQGCSFIKEHLSKSSQQQMEQGQGQDQNQEQQRQPVNPQHS